MVDSIKILSAMHIYAIIFGIFCFWGTNTTDNGKPFNKVRFSSHDYVAHLEIKLSATVVDRYHNIIHYDQEDIFKANLYTFRPFGEIVLRKSKNVLTIEFDFTTSDGGYEMTLGWCTFGTLDRYTLYKSKENQRLSIAIGSSTIKDVKMMYSRFPQSADFEGISLNIIEANIHIRSVTDLKDELVAESFNKGFDDPTIISWEMYYEKPTRTPEEELKHMLESKEFDEQ